MPASAAATSFYLPQLDGLRCYAFLAVFVSHVAQLPLVPPTALSWTSLAWWGRGAALAGVFGVDLFFVLSSFLITSLLLREAETHGRIHVPAFWLRRALRIWPLYQTYVALCWLVEGLPARVVLSFAFFLGNWPGLVGDVGRSVIGVLWSVSVEEQFYLVWPLVLVVVPRRWLPPACVAMIAVSLATRAWLLASGAGFAEVWLNTFARLDPIAVGALIALWYRRQPPALTPSLRALLGVGGPLVLVVCASVVSHHVIRADGRFPVGSEPATFAAASLVFLVVALCGGGLLLVALGARGPWLRHPVVIYLGRISYGLYVFHMASLRTVETLGWPWRVVLGLGLTVLLAAVSYQILENPFLRLKGRATYVASGQAESM